MTDVPSNLIPTRITQLPEYSGSSQEGFLPYVLGGVTYKVQFSNVASAGEVPPSRTLTAGTGLTGGGDLSADRVFAIAVGGVGADQLDTTGVVAGVYGDGSNVPTVTVDANGRVTSVSTSPVIAPGYVPESRTVTAGTGLLGGGSLASNITLSVNLASATPQALGSATVGVSTAAAREDHVHPAVDLSDTNETQGSLPLGRGGTGDALSPVAGAVVYSTGTKFALTNPGVIGQVLTSTGTGEPVWATPTASGGTVTSVNASGGATGMTFTGGPITDAGTLTLGGTLAVGSGGTGLAATPTNGQLLIGNSAGYTLAALTPGSGVSVTNAAGSIIIDNTAPDQIVSLTAGTAVSVGGTYPNFTIDNTAPDQIVSLTGAGTTSISGTYPNFTITSTGGTGTVTSVDVLGGSTGLTFTGGPITTSGTLTVGGTLSVANGGTGNSSWAAGALISFNSPTNAVAILPGTSGQVLTTGGVGTIPTWGFLNLATSVTGTLSATNGGTGTATYTTGDILYASAANTLSKLPIGANGTVLTSNGTNVSWQAGGGGGGGGGGVTSFSTGTTGLTPSAATTGAVTLAGTLALANGGTGQTTKLAAFNALSPTTSAGDMIYRNAFGNNQRLAIGTSGRYLRSNGSDPSWQFINFSDTTGTVPIFRGGTGTTSSPSDGSLFIGNSGGFYSVSTLTAGANVTITNGPGSITIAASGGAPSGPYITFIQVRDFSFNFYSNSTSPQPSPMVFYDAGTNSAAIWFYQPSYFGSNIGTGLDEIIVDDSGGGTATYVNGTDFSAGSWYAAGDGQGVFGVYDLSVFNSALQTLLANTAAQVVNPALAPGSTTAFGMNAIVDMQVSGGVGSSFYSNNPFGQSYPIGVTGSFGSYSIYFYSDSFTPDSGLSLDTISVFDQTGASVGTFFNFSDYSVSFAQNSTNGLFSCSISVFNATLQSVLDNSVIV